MNLDLISRRRSELMGFAIIIVMLFHVNTPRADAFFGLRRMGNLGVDIFLFLSGIGLWFSWAKQQNWKRFYLNRALRIYPAWLLVAGYFYISNFHYGRLRYALPFGGTGDAGIDSVIDLCGEVIFNWDFWLHDELTFWYVPATMMLYLFAPMYMELVRRWPVYRWLVVLPLMWPIMVQYITPIHQAVGHIEIFWSRVPIFFLGINIAESIRQKKTIDRAAWPMVIGLFAISLGACIWLEQMRHGRFPLYTERMLYIVLAVTTVLIVSGSLGTGTADPKSGSAVPVPSDPLCKALAWVGGISLEIYLVHIEFILKPLYRLHLGYWPTALLLIAISLPVAWIVAKISNWIGSWLRRVVI